MTQNSTVDDFLAELKPELREIAIELRAVIRDEVPDAIEMVDSVPPMIGYGLDRGYKGLISAIAPYREHVNLMLSRGAELPDPTHLLEGTGKRARHVTVRPGGRVNEPAVRSLIRKNAELIRQSMLNRG